MFNNTTSYKSSGGRSYSKTSETKVPKVKRKGGMWAGGAQCVHASLPRGARATPAPTLSGAIASRRPPRPSPPSPTLVAQIDSSVACLWLLTPLSAGTAVVAVLVAVSTNNWLHTQENMLNPSYNGTGRHDLVAKQTVSGLWRICHTDPGSTVFRCLDIPYFPLSQWQPDPSDSTNAIPYVVTRSAAPLLLAVFTQAVGALCCVLGHCVKGRRLCTFIAGVLFIISGLIMLTGIVMYISVFKSQVNHKLRYMAYFDTPRMSYSYGYSFGLYISGFVAAELAGTSAIFLFLQWYQKDWITELTEKAKADCRAWDREYAFTEFRERDSTLLERRMMKRDTYPPTGSSAATPRERRRFVFDGDDMPHCSIHNKNRRINLSSASLKDLSSSTLYGFPAAPRPTACDNYFEEFKEVPQSANTLSGLRSASIFQSQASVASGRFLDTSAVEPPPSREEEMVTFGAGARGGEDQQPPRHDRAVGTDPYRRTTPV
ncbi:voltage-dependent calcium channel gamma-4 subunit isoform X1 [Helicoverpa armigera]|uniref:voltage-dependent calcium channel gamma-4 subunit isoform X1 n=2 Tax=Helicoverpa armigera TaxID=29058 RepID=UPI001F5A3D49|nr:voltage-dependent calcium channel gamma-4 subunit isoform X1 [Helicoverpa zea]